jgi:hypothetical protein
MKNRFFGLLLVASLLGAASAQAAVWQETQSWNSSWEAKYSEWIRTSFNEEIFVTGPYKGIPTDCSDAAYAARLIFAYENKLPFVIKDPSGGASRITNKMSRFDNIGDSLQRVRKFILYVGDVTGTKSLPNDTYPVVVSREYVRPGTVWARVRVSRDSIVERILHGGVTEDPGHAEIVKDVSDVGAIYLIGSTVPKTVRQLHTTSSLVFMPIETSTGLRNWKQPEYYNMSETSIPGYSLEQFTTLGKGGLGGRKLSRWADQVQDRLALRQESQGESVSRQVENVCALVTSRVDNVQRGEARRLKLGGACMDAGDYDSYSTPSRDKRIKATLKALTQAAESHGITKVQRTKKLKEELDKCPAIQYAPGQFVTLYDFSIALLKNDVSSDPNDSLAARWGLAPKTSNCKQYE